MIGNSFYSPKDILNKNSNSLLELNENLIVKNYMKKKLK